MNFKKTNFLVIFTILLSICVIYTCYFYINLYINFSGTRISNTIFLFYEVDKSPSKIWNDSRLYATSKTIDNFINNIKDKLNIYSYSKEYLKNYKQINDIYNFIKSINSMKQKPKTYSEIRNDYFGKNFILKSPTILPRDTIIRGRSKMSKANNITYIKIEILDGVNIGKTGWIKISDWNKMKLK